MFVSTFTVGTASVVVVMSDATDMGVFPPNTPGVSETPDGVCSDVPRLPFRLPGVITWERRRLALAIHARSPESCASRYSCWVSISTSSGKKSRAMISEIASVYDSSSMTFFGRLMRFGGGGINAVSFERRARARDLRGSIAMPQTSLRSQAKLSPSMQKCRPSKGMIMGLGVL